MTPLLIVDGYNILGAMKNAAGLSLEEQRRQLCEMLQNYSGYTGCDIVVVFDGYKTDRQERSVNQLKGLTVVFTRRGETADSYIERYAASCPRYREVRVATSDGFEQSQVLSTGAIRISAREMLSELEQTSRTCYINHIQSAGISNSTKLASRLSSDIIDKLEIIRRSTDTN